MSRKISIVIQREYTSRVKKRSFLLMTILMPLIFSALIFVPLWMSKIKDDQVREVAVIDQTGKYFSWFKNTETYRFTDVNNGATTEYNHHQNANGIYATLIISDDLLRNHAGLTLYSDKQTTDDLKNLIANTLNSGLRDEKLASYQIANLKEIIEESKISVQIQTLKIGKDGAKTVTSAAVAEVTGILFTFIIYLFIFVYGGMVMQGVMEEKTNRIIEIMVSSVKPFDLMMGKIIGIGLVGITQFVLWIILGGILISFGGFMWGSGNLETPNQMMFNMQEVPAISPQQAMPELLSAVSSINLSMIIGLFFVYFIGGYMLYASLFAAIGASVNSSEDSQQFMLPITALVLFAFYAAIYSIQNPDGPLAFWTSIIPFTAPIVMMVRLPFDVPVEQILLSIALLYATFLLVVRFSAKIYRVGILMYGKKPGFKELIKWIKYQ